MSLLQQSPLGTRSAFYQLHSESTSDNKQELVTGLRLDQAQINPKFLYDALGSCLFDAITQVPEYYPTRCEHEVFDTHGDAIAQSVGHVQTMIDLGAADCMKAKRLFDRLQPEQYVPVDISVDYLKTSVMRVAALYPDLDIVGVGIDFFHTLALPQQVRPDERLFFYPGSSIGNLNVSQAQDMLKRIRNACGPGGKLLLGVDRVKSAAILEPAYDDALGVTAAFNLNVLRHANRLMGSNFDIEDWAHRAVFNTGESRIEMHLEALHRLKVKLPDGERIFEQGETIHTESSYKYQPEQFAQMLRDAGFKQISHWTDSKEWFSVFAAVA